MFMQLGFALLETGLTRAKNVSHTMDMNIFVYAIGVLCFWAVGFALQMGGVGALGTFGNDATLSHEISVQIAGKDFGLFGATGLFLSVASYTPAVAALFLFQMVFMDTAATLCELGVGGRMAFRAWQELRTRPWSRRLCGELRRAHDGRCHGPRRREDDSATAGQILKGWEGKRDPSPQRPNGRNRHAHPRLWMVRLQSWLHLPARTCAFPSSRRTQCWRRRRVLLPRAYSSGFASESPT
jgi:hypothetical protein